MFLLKWRKYLFSTRCTEGPRMWERKDMVEMPQFGSGTPRQRTWGFCICSVLTGPLVDPVILSLLCGVIGTERRLLGCMLEELENFSHKWTAIYLRTQYKSSLFHMHTAGQINVWVELMFLEIIQGLSFREAQPSSDGKFWGRFKIVSIPKSRKTWQSWLGSVSRPHHEMTDCISILCLVDWALVDGYIWLQGKMGNVVHLYPE